MFFSDILRTSINPACTSASTSSKAYDNSCSNNYLLNKGTSSELYYWTINAYSYEPGGYASGTWYDYEFSAGAGVRSDNTIVSNRSAPRPVVFLKSDTQLTGSGTVEDPFTVV